MAICLERFDLLAFGFSVDFCADLLKAVRLLFPFGVWGRMLNSIVSVPDHCVSIYF